MLPCRLRHQYPGALTTALSTSARFFRRIPSAISVTISSRISLRWLPARKSAGAMCRTRSACAQSCQHLRKLPLEPVDRFLVQRLLRELKLYREELKTTNRQITAFTGKAPPAEALQRKLLESVPAVGPVTRETFLAEVAGPERFSSAKKLTSYVGLAPGQRESAGKRRDLGITHAGSPILRWALHQAAWQLVRRSPRWKETFEKIAARRGKKKAITAIARRLLCLMLAVIRSGKPYQESSPAAQAA